MKVTVNAVPLSVNHLYPTGAHGKRFKSPKAAEFLQLLALQTRGERLEGWRFRLTVDFRFADERKHDLSNVIKHLEDCLVDLGVIPDDDGIVELVLRKWPANGKPQTIIEIEAL